MTEFFLSLLNLSIQAGYLVLAVLLLRLFLKKAPKWIAPILWGIVALRLLLPVSLESALSLLPQKEPISPQILYTQESPQTQDISPDVPMPSVDTPSVDPPAVDVSPSQQPEPSGTPAAPTISVTAPAHSPAQVALNIGLFVWLAGLSVMLLSTGISYINLRRSILTAVRKQENIYQSETVGSPFVLGLLRARIYLPFSLPEQDIPYIIAHEKAHIRRLDHFWKPLGFLLLAVHWFNPLIWVAYILLCRDIELACDEAVIQKLEASQRADYSQALLHCSTPRKSIAACPVAFGEFGVKARVKQILRYNKPAFWIVLIAIIVCIAVAVCFLTVPPQTNPPQTNVAAQKALRMEIAAPSAPEGMPSRYLYFPLNESEHTVAFEAYPLELTLDATEDQVTLAFSAELLQDGAPVKQIVLRPGDSIPLNAPTEGTVTYIFSLVDQEEILSAQLGQEQSMLWFDLLAKPDEGFVEASYSSPDFPGAQFHCDGKAITVETEDGTRTVLTADAILNAYFYDITGDSLPELCITAQVGQNTQIYAYVYYEAKLYELATQGEHDYMLVKTADQLLVHPHSNDTPANTPPEGTLLLSGGELTILAGITTVEPTEPLTEPPTEPPTEPTTEPPTEPTEPPLPERYYNPRYRAKEQNVNLLGDAIWVRKDLEREKWVKDSYAPGYATIRHCIDDEDLRKYVLNVLEKEECKEGSLYIQKTEGKMVQISAEPVLHYATSRNYLFYATESHEVYQTDYSGSYHKLIYTSQSKIQGLSYWAECLYVLEAEQVVRVDLATLETMTGKNPAQCKCLFISEDGMVIYYIDEGNAWLLNMHTGESKFLDTPAKMDDYLRVEWGISSISPSKEVAAMYKAFLEAGKTDYPAAVAQYCHFEDNDYREKVMQSPNAFILDYELVRWEKISEELWVAWTIISDAQFPEAFETAHFVGLVDGKFQVMLRAEQVPETLADWIYLDPFVLMGEGADA